MSVISLKLNRTALVTSIGSLKSLILATESASDRGINLQPESGNNAQHQLVTITSSDYDNDERSNVPSPSTSASSFDIVLIVCSEIDYYNRASSSSRCLEEADVVDAEDMNANRKNNLSVFSFRVQNNDSDGGACEEDVANAITDVCSKALLVVDSTADSHSRLNAVSGACLDCNMFFMNNSQSINNDESSTLSSSSSSSTSEKLDAFTSHLTSVHGSLFPEIIERRRRDAATNNPQQFAAFYTPKSSKVPQLVEALPWQHLSVVMPHQQQNFNTPSSASPIADTKLSNGSSIIEPKMEMVDDLSKLAACQNLAKSTPTPVNPPSATSSSGANRVQPTPTPGSSHNAGTTRCVSKTLKCPRCNWHYKYQETLEIHMREKHPDADSSQCIYCATKREHPRLSRGENYSCGYKPYRCEICNYATTTKGNLSIHMQSDKHLHNVQEFAASQGADARPAPSAAAAAIEASTLAAAAATFQQQQHRSQQQQQSSKSAVDLHSVTESSSKTQSSSKTSPSNLKSEPRRPSHQLGNSQTSNKSVAKLLAENKPSDRTLSMPSFPTAVGGSTSSAASALASLAASSSSSLFSGSSISSMPSILNDVSVDSIMQQYALCRDLVMSPEFQQQAGCDSATASLLLQQLATAALTASTAAAAAPANQSNLLNSLAASLLPASQQQQQQQQLPLTQTPKSSKVQPSSSSTSSLVQSNSSAKKHSNAAATTAAASTNSTASSKLYECLLCDSFATDSLTELKTHMDFDRTLNPPIHDFDHRILAMIDNYYFCKLCSYKTPLKANFQVHSKTEKHLQKFQMLLHIMEGGAKCEQKLANFPNVTTSVRCVACDFPAASAHRLDQHAMSVGHELFCKLAADIAQLGGGRYQFVCRLCSTAGNGDNIFASRSQLSRHLASPEHMRQETFFQAQRSTLDASLGLGLSGTVPEIDLRQLIEVEPVTGSQRAVSPASSSFVSLTPEADNSSSATMPSRFGSTMAVPAMLASKTTSHQSSVLCPICQLQFDSHSSRVEHLTDVHSVPKANVPRLLELMALVDGGSVSATPPPQSSILSSLPIDNNTPLALTTSEKPNLKRPHSRDHSESSNRQTGSPIDLSVPKRVKSSAANSLKVSQVKDEPKISTPFQSQLNQIGADALSALTSQLNYDQMIQSLLSSAFPQSLLPNATNLLPNSATSAINQLAAQVAAAAAASNPTISSAQSAQSSSLTEEQFRCHSCTRLFATVDNLFSHLAESQHLNSNAATIKGPGMLCWKKGCNQYFKSVHTLKMHFRQIHNFQLPDFILNSNSADAAAAKQVAKPTNSNSSKSLFKCSHCPMTFENSVALESHGKLHLANMSGFTCAVCNARLESFNEYTEHLNSHRLDQPQQQQNLTKTLSSSSIAGNAFRCDACNVSFPDVDLFRGHCHSVAHKINSAENGITLGASKKSSSNNSNSKQSSSNGGDDALLTGVFGATPSGSYTCDICEISFARQTYLQQHLLSPFHQRSVKRLQDTLMERGRMSIMDTLQQAYQSSLPQQPQQAVLNPLANLGGLDLATVAAALNNPLLASQLLATLGGTNAFPTTAASLFAGGLQIPPNIMLPNLQPQQQLPQLPTSNKKSPGKSSPGRFDGGAGSSSAPLSASTPLADRHRNKSSAGASCSKDGNASSSSSNCSTCSTLHDLDDPMPLMEHQESTHGLSITAHDVEEVIKHKPEIFGAKVGEEFKQATQSSGDEEGSSQLKRVPEKLKPNPTQAASTAQSLTSEALSAAVLQNAASLDLLNQLDPLLSFCASAGLLDPLTAASTASALLAAQSTPKLATPSTDNNKPQPATNNASSGGDSGRTRITDEQRAVFREYFNINNLPSDVEIDEICRRTNLGRKVVKHWFRNTLFKERQRSQNSPYNLNIPPILSATPTVDEDHVSPMVKEEEKPVSAMEIGADKEQHPDEGDMANINNDEYDDYDDEIEQPRSYGGMDLDDSRSNSPADGKSGGSWRRASRTKFSDEQVQALNEAFERNAYPREEDQKKLSQQLGLSQRVIIVWFQNQRQKTRRSSQGSVLSVASSGRGSDHNGPVETLRLNNEQSATSITANLLPDNFDQVSEPGDVEHCSNGGADDEQDCVDSDQPEQPQTQLSLAVGTTANGNKRSRTTISAEQQAIMYETFQNCQNPTRDQLETLCGVTGLSRRTVQVWFQNQRSRERKSNNLANRPELAALLAYNDNSSRNGGNFSNQAASTIDFDSDNNSMSGSNGLPEADAGDNNSNSCHSLPGNNSSSNSNNNNNSNNKRRFRTQLSAVQVRIMRALFKYCKTPSQSECLQLGAELGLQKSVIQVWFQNARAKEKKAKLGFISNLATDYPQPLESGTCPDCNESTGNMADHIWTKAHIDALRLKFGSADDEGDSYDQDDQEQHQNGNGLMMHSSASESESGGQNESESMPLNLTSAMTSPALLTSNVQ